MHKQKVPACVSITKTETPPEWMYTLQSGDRLVPVLPPKEDRVTRRQEATPTYVLNGAVYVADTGWFCEHKSSLHKEYVAYMMPSERAVDVDDAVNMKIAESVIKISD